MPSPTPQDRPAVAEVLLTATEFVEHERELAELRRIRDQDLPLMLREARTYVAADAVEDIAHIQEQQTVNGARIARLEELLNQATIVSDEQATDLVSLGTVIEVQYARTGRRMTFRLTGSGTGPDGRSVSSARSPVGRALDGPPVGDVVAAEPPGGCTEQLQIMVITPAVAEAA